jgi:hypothetical protein
LATLRWNKLHIPSGHPASIKGVIIIAEDTYPEPSAEELSRRIQGRLSAASEVAADAQVDAIPVRTNIRYLVDDGWFYDQLWHGAVLSSMAYFFGKRFHKAYIGSTCEAAHLHPWGSHPLLDPCYSSAHVQIEHHGWDMTRLLKTILVANWPVGLQNIRVCQNDASGTRNCGTCEKCIRTMATLVALGKLRHCRSFPVNDVTPELLMTVQQYDMIQWEDEAIWYRQLVPALQKAGRDDLASVVVQLLCAYQEKLATTGSPFDSQPDCCRSSVPSAQRDRITVPSLHA